MMGDMALTRWLVEEAGANLHAVEARGRRPKDVARLKGHQQVKVYLEARE